MKKIILAITFLASAAFAGEVETVGVKGMVCSFCAQGITKKFKEQPEVAEVQVSLEQKFVKLTYKDGQKLSHDKIATLLKEAGYEASFGK
ncbi:heavy-metal-associated domain-containing protein [Bdellovibrio sp. 22V]|uniref:heavy-metal-associated domain-containing protein n=1 Tax=Bdellovibrio TaxID=958 RepID=UPI002542ADAE|nr:heavy-metal-associated domain-containing protein [Bdellovibrio sp. 22V]WII71799.1 heavy-metal-associated domain-containing protein [Bdellovibrio sp. 22V]